jgi:thioredoxin
MKKLSFLLVFAVILFTGCSNASDGKGEAGDSGQNVQQTSLAENGSEDASKAKPIKLDKELFKQLVMDYEKNPREWVYEGDKPAVIDFYADWCRPCRMIAPIMEELAAEYEGQVNIYKIDTEEQRELASVFGITSLPTVLFVPAEGKPSAQKGALPKESYKKIIDEFLLNKNTQTQ